MRRAALQSLSRHCSRLRVLVILLVVGSLLLLSAAFMTFTAHEVTGSTLAQGDAAARDILRVVLLNLGAQKDGLDSFRTYARQSHEQHLRDLVGVAEAQVDYFHGLQLRGLLSEARARQAALEAIQTLRYGNNDYFFIYDRRNVAISHADPRVRGRDMSETTDERGRPVSRTMWEMVRTRPDGFITMWWTRLGEKTPVPKLLYFRHYPQWDWLIGTGVYIDDIERDVARKMAESMVVLKKTFDQVRIAETGYFSLFDGSGRILLHPFLAGTDGGRLRDPVTGRAHLADLMSAAQNPEIPYTYLWDKPASPGEYRYRKYSHVERFAPFDWYVSSSVYEDEMERPGRRILVRQGLFAAGLLFVTVAGAALLASRVTRPLARLEEHATRLEQHDFSLPPDDRAELLNIGYPREVATLARTLHRVEARLDDYLVNLRETTAAREKIASELRIAHDIQMSMLPDPRRLLRDYPELELAATLVPAREVGGDLFDIFPVGPRRLCFLVGDVSDKGVPAALFMARGKAILRSAACRPGATPDGILAEAGRELAESNEQRMHITACLGIIDLDSGEVTYSNAGHLPPLLQSAGQWSWLDTPPGRPLGTRRNLGYATRTLRLAAGDCLLLLTDGVTEAENAARDFFGEERPLDALSTSAGPAGVDGYLRRLLDDVRSFAGEAPQSDDIALLCLCLRSPASFSSSLTLAPGDSPAALLALLDAAEEGLAATPAAAVLPDLRLVLEEHLINILEHGTRLAGVPLEVYLAVRVEGEGVRATIIDNGQPFDPLTVSPVETQRSLRERSRGGQGVKLLRRLAGEVTCRRLDGRNVLRLLIRPANC